jgi:Mrp family chromosome partitioning ATPase
MNREGSSRQFSNGNPECGLDDALEVEKRDGAMVQENLYVVRESPTNDKLPYALPRRFKHLVPRLKASDYDYIIFDLPPISQISVTSRLARFMDMALIVVEAEQTDGDVVKRAGKELALTGANVGIVLNKSRDYLPKRLSQEL